MPLDPDKLLAALQAHAQTLGQPAHCYVALSGGRDSSVLLALLARVAPRLRSELIAVHVNHQLQPGADAWQAHCEQFASRLNVPFHALSVQVEVRGGAGLEGNAREARYRALADLLQAGDWLLTGHHADDQAETLLLNLMRGSGVSGMRGIANCRALGRGYLLRPLLGAAATDIEAYGRQQRLDWINDPSNQDTSHDRNFLRARVLPVLAERWPAAHQQLALSARLAADAAQLNQELAALDIKRCGSAGRLSITALQSLSAARQANLLRHACGVAGLPLPPRRQLAAILSDLPGAGADRAPCVTWPGAEARRYRDHLYLLATPALDGGAGGLMLHAGDRVALGNGLGELQLSRGPQGGISPQLAEQGLTVSFRRGGESLQPHGRGTRKTLKKLTQEAGIVPWMRARLPLLYADDALVAVADLWLAQEHFAPDGYHVVWEKKPALH
jgi:tRNA(Ile)-lysidine synthase